MANDDYREQHERDRAAGLAARHETRVERAIRRQVAEEIAQAIQAARIQHNWNVIAIAAAGECATIARNIGSRGAPDGSKPRVDPGVDSDLLPEPQAVSKRVPERCGLADLDNRCIQFGAHSNQATEETK